MKLSTFLPVAMTPAAPSQLVNEHSRRSAGAQTRSQPSGTVVGAKVFVRALGMAVVAALIAATLVLFVFARWHASEGPYDSEWDASSGCPVSQCGLTQAGAMIPSERA